MQIYIFSLKRLVSARSVYSRPRWMPDLPSLQSTENSSSRISVVPAALRELEGDLIRNCYSKWEIERLEVVP